MPEEDCLTTYDKSVVIPSLGLGAGSRRPHRYAEGRLMNTITGGCLCGRVRYTVTGEPIRSYVCHCRDCQRATAAPLAAGIAVPAGAVHVQGELKTFGMAGGSGQTVHRNFCPNCGSWVTGSANPDFISVLVGTLDDPNLFEPEFEQFFGSAQRWMHAGGDRVRYPGRRT